MPSSTTANSPAAPWSFARLLSAPHRLGFFAAAVGLGLSALWWALALLARSIGLELPWAVAPGLAHGLLLAGGFMPFFIVGFLFTAGPRWLGLGEVNAETLLRPVLLMGGGWALALLGFHAHVGLAALGVLAVTLGWTWVLGRFIRLIRISPVPDQLHPRAVAFAGLQGVLGFAVAALALALGEPGWLRAAVYWLIWAFLAPTFAIVSHRMIPFFTAAVLPFLDAWKPNWLLAVMGAALGAGALDAVALSLGWTLPTAMHGLLAFGLGASGCLLVWLALRWGLVQSLKIKLLAMLHGGFVWFGLALLLAALGHALQALGRPDLGLAPLHALTLGYLGCTLIAMVTRVASGHSGRPLAVDGIAWGLYGLLQLTVLLRLAAALLPRLGTPLLLAAAAGWALVSLSWAWRYGGWLGRPRIDGRPG
ncbi:uncharacterized protein involved in response to NO [Inhella inkyongensis]|uniref:Uncharacterized protein involved in response to NO n=1 Tax=Inhella inkyongensis TaxID=392593 RepID=A0A840S899_9BURK|nr:NnrS family protein [Inhella inkyongensis]MBB5205024.1 uncharacterized protein involved in response to NO [Inhella inkyongensis]